MAEYDFIQDINLGLKPKEAKEAKDVGHEGHDHGTLAKAIEHRRPDALGAGGAMHLQRAAGNAAMGALVQRGSEEESPVHAVLGKGGGSSLDSGVREKMESTMGHDFSGVRIHTGPEASAAATSVQAQAFTVGNDVVFNEGKYSPTSPEGQRTIAHELTHVVQQSRGSVPGESRGDGIKVSDPGDWAEEQAEATADAVMASDGAGPAGHDHATAGAGGAAVQTLPLQREESAAPEEEELQPLRDASIQREESAAPEEEELQPLRDASIQREEAEEPEMADAEE